MKKLIFLSLILLVRLTGSSQTVIITPTIGASSQSLQAVGDNTLTRMYVAMTSTPGIYVQMSSITSTLTSSPSSVTTSGTVTAGARSILFETSSTFVGTIDGLVFLPSGFLSYPITPGSSWPAIPYTITSGTLYIRKFN